MDYLLETKNLKKYYGRSSLIKAVDGVSLRIREGRSMGLIGESGSGKTTFGKLAAGLEKATSGTITFMGQEIQDLRETKLRDCRKNLQMVFQSSGSIFDPSYTVGENIREVLKNYVRLPREEYDRRITDIFHKVGLESELSNYYASQLSGGQCQRANIARALILHPKLVVCDEPVSSLDYSIRKQILNLLKEMQKEFGVTYLLITHDLSNVPYVCDEVAIMYQGKIVEQMSETKLMERNAIHPYTKLLFQSIPSADPRKRKIGLRTAEKELTGLRTAEGCNFQNRCNYCTEKCRNQEPLLREAAPGHWVACHLLS